MNFCAAIDTDPWSNKDHSNSVLSSRLYSPVCLGILISVVADGVRTWIALGSWSGSEWGPKPAQTTGHFKYILPKNDQYITGLNNYLK